MKPSGEGVQVKHDPENGGYGTVHPQPSGYRQQQMEFERQLCKVFFFFKYNV